MVNDFVKVHDSTSSSSSSGSSSSNRAIVFYDASLSRAKTERSKETGLLRKILGQFSSSGIEEVDIVVFRNAPEKPKTFSIKAADELLGVIEGAFFDGGTKLASIEALAVLSQEH